MHWSHERNIKRGKTYMMGMSMTTGSGHWHQVNQHYLPVKLWLNLALGFWLLVWSHFENEKFNIFFLKVKLVNIISRFKKIRSNSHLGPARLMYREHTLLRHDMILLIYLLTVGLSSLALHSCPSQSLKPRSQFSPLSVHVHSQALFSFTVCST